MSFFLHNLSKKRAPRSLENEEKKASVPKGIIVKECLTYNAEKALKYLKSRNLNVEGTPGQLLLRCWLSEILGEHLSEFDGKKLDDSLQSLRTNTKTPIEEEVNQLCDLTRELLEKLLDKTDATKLQLIEKLKELIFDCRLPSKRQNKRRIQIEQECCQQLGFCSREEILELSHAERLKRMRNKNLHREEYDNNEEHLKSNIILLLDRMVRQKDITLNFRDKSANKKFMELCNCHKDIDFIDQLSIADMNKYSIELGLIKDGTEIFETLLQYDVLIEKMKNHASQYSRKLSLLEVNYQEIHNSLPSLKQQASKVEGSAYFDPLSVLVKTTKVGSYAEIREIGIRCDGGFVYETKQSDDILMLSIPPHTYHLKWESEDTGIENSKSFDTVLSSPNPGNQTLRYLYFSIDEEVFQLDYQTKELLFASQEYKNILCKSIDIASNDGKYLFTRLIMQIKIINYEKMAKIIDRICDHSIKYEYQESGNVLARALEFHCLKEIAWKLDDRSSLRLLQLEQSPSLMYNMSGFLRTCILPTINNLHASKWSQLKNPHDLPTKKEAKKMLTKLMLAGPKDIHVSVVTEPQLEEMKKLLSERFHFPFHQYQVERSNLQSVIRSLDEISSSSNVAVCALYVTGRISGSEICRLIDRSNMGTLRLLILFYPQLIKILQMTGRISSVLLTKGLAAARSDKVSPYSPQNILFPIIQHSSFFFTNRESLDLSDETEQLYEDISFSLDWEINEAKWRESPSTEFSFKIFVTNDMNMVEFMYNKNHFGNRTLLLVKCQSGNIEKTLNIFLPSSRKLDFNEGILEQELCVVLLNAHLLSDSQRVYVVSRSIESRCKLIHVVETFNPEDLTFHIEQPHIVVKGERWNVLPSLAILKTIFHQENKNSIIIYRSLRLLLGNIVKTDLFSSMSASNVQSIDGLVSYIIKQDLNLQQSIVHDCVSEIIDSLDCHGTYELENFQTLHHYISWLCLDFVKKNSLERDVPFEFFVKNVSVCQFLSQEDRIECWIRTVLLNKNQPASSVIDYFKKKNQGINVHTNQVLSYMRQLKDPRLAIEKPSYAFVEPDASVSQDQLLLQQCIQGNELDWDYLQSEWRIFPHSLDFLMNLILVYPQPFKLLFMIPPSSLYRVLENATKERYPETLAKLKKLLSPETNHTCLKFLESVGLKNYELRSYISVMRWSLLTSRTATISDIPFEQRDVEVLLSYHIPLSVGENYNTTSFIISIMLQLEGPSDVIYQQAQLRSYLLKLEDSDVSNILDAEYPLGTAFLDFIFNYHIRKGEPKKKYPLLLHPFVKGLIDWLESAKKLNSSYIEKSTRFSPQAIGFLVSKCSLPEHIKIVLEIISKKLTISKNPQRVLNELLDSACDKLSAPSQMIILLEYLTSKYSLEEIKCINPFYQALLESMYKNSLEPLLNFSVSNQLFSIDISEKLCNLCKLCFSDEKIQFPNALKTESVPKICELFSDSGFESLYMTLAEQVSQKSFKNRFLLFLAWLKAPFQPLICFPKPDEFRAFKSLCHEEAIDLKGTVKKHLNTVSNFALYLIAPDYLNVSTVNFFNKKLGLNEIQERYLVVAQKGVEHASSFTIRIPERPLPFTMLKNLINKEYNLSEFIWSERKSAIHLEFFVTTGVDVEMIEKNLAALVNLNNTYYEQDGELKSDKDTTNTRYFLTMSILAWFWSMGFSFQSIRQMLRENAVCLDWIEIFSSNPGAASLHPLPTFVDTTVRRSTDLQLFGITKEDSLYTHQCFTSFLSEEDIRSFPKTGDLLILTKLPDSDIERMQPTSVYEKLHIIASQKFGKTIAKQLMTIPDEEAQYDLTQLENFCHSFTLCITSLSDRTKVKEMLESTLKSVQEGLVNAIDRREAIFTRCLFRRIGITRNSVGVLEILVNACNNLKFHFCKSSSDELIYNYQHGFPASNTFIKEELKIKIQQKDTEDVLDFLFLKRTLPQNTAEWIKEESNLPEMEKIITTGEKKFDSIPSNFSDNFFIEKKREESVSGYSSFTFKLSLSSNAPRVLENSQWIIDCRTLLELCKDHTGFVSLRVKPGMEGYLLRETKGKSCRNFKFVQGENLEGFGISNDIEDRIIEAYPNNNIAWQSISRYPPLTLLVMDGLLLKKSLDNSIWVPIILNSSVNNKQGSYYSHLFFWHLLDLHLLLCFQLDPPVVSFLEFLCGMVYNIITSGNDTKNWEIDKIMPWLRDLDNFDNECTNEAHRVAHQLGDFVSRVIVRASDPKTKMDVVTVINQIKEEEDYVNEYFEILADFGNKVQEHIMQTLHFREKLRQILTHRVDLDYIFGEEAVHAFNDFISKIEPQKTENDTEDIPIKNIGYNHFEAIIGFGKGTANDDQVISLIGPDPKIIFYYLDKVVHKQMYNSANGCIVAYFLHYKSYRFLDKCPQNIFTKWLVDVLRSPLSLSYKLWFLNMCQNYSAKPPPVSEFSTLENSNSFSGTLVVASSLARNCPSNTTLSPVFKGACKLPEQIEPFCRRKDGKYGVYFCTTDTLSKMIQVGLRVEVVDVGIASSSGMVTTDELYLQIISLFKGFICFVYVRGLEYVDDLFLKWCCEYTERCPWRFIYFERTDSSFNFSENRDRCEYFFYHKASLLELRWGNSGRRMDIQKIRFTTHKNMESDKLQNFFSVYFPKSKDWPFKAIAMDDWEELFDKTYKTQKQSVLMLVSPPGAGKTYQLESLVKTEKQSRICHRIDCSNDELVERAMESVLSEKFSRDGVASLLIADEFHMLSKEHKEQVFNWIATRLHWLKVVLIANRTNEFDDKLLKQLEFEHPEVHIQKFLCRLSISKIEQVANPKIQQLYEGEKLQKDVTSFVIKWYRACRALFSDECLTLRNIDQLLLIYKDVHKAAENALAAFLDKKMPNLGDYTCWNFAHHILQFHRQNNIKDIDNSPMKLLVKTALLDSTNQVCSYPEFSSRLPGAFKAHPIIRLAAWITMVHEYTKQTQPNLDILTRLQLVNQVGFPLVIQTIGSSTSLLTCEAICRRGDYSDLNWMDDVLAHGYGMDWESVKKVWNAQFITDPAQFEKLISVCPDPSACLSAIHPKNLTLLIESSRALSLAERVISHYNYSEVDHNLPDSPFYSAAWFLFRNQSKPLTTDILVKHGISVLKCLLWASLYGYHLLNVVDDSVNRKNFIRKTLVDETINLLRKMDGENNKKTWVEYKKAIIELWSHLFAPLLVVGTRVRCMEQVIEGVPYEVALILAESQYPALTQWPRLVQELSNILHKRADPSVVDSLVDHEIFTRLKERDKTDMPHEFCLPGEPYQFVSGLLSITQPLSKKWQLRLLTTSGVKIPDEFCNDQSLSKLLKGLFSLNNVKKLKIKDGRVKSQLIEYHGKKFRKKITKTSNWDVGQGQRTIEVHNMRFLKRLTTKSKILNYYNVYAGAHRNELECNEFDVYKNPQGSKYDLGKDSAFSEFKLLIGNFFQRTKEFDQASFVSHAIKALEEKGFLVEITFSEEKFCESLIEENCEYDVAWLISSDALDWNMRAKSCLEKWQKLADACEYFHKSGRGIFLFADNDPFYDHTNVVLERLVKSKLVGNTPGQQQLKAGECNIQGQFGEHLITSALEYLYEGVTICYPEPLGELSILATSSNNHPVILYADNKDGTVIGEKRGNLEPGFGRLVVDTGFTKLWKEWKTAGTARYICNATVWLLGIDYRLQRGFPIQGPINKNPKCNYGKTPTSEPKEVSDGKVDVLLLMDGSGSVSDNQFQIMKNFARRLVESLEVSKRGVHFGIIQFDTQARTEIPLSSNKAYLNNAIDGIVQTKGGTDFVSPLKQAQKEFKHLGRPGIKKVILLQTDGQAEMEGPLQLASQMKRKGIIIFTAGVGPGAKGTQLYKLASQAKYNFDVENYDQIDTIRQVFVAECKAT